MNSGIAGVQTRTTIVDKDKRHGGMAVTVAKKRDKASCKENGSNNHNVEGVLGRLSMRV